MKKKINDFEIIIQAGGRGSRLRHFTWNKPKCLVSYNGKPVIYHLFEKFKKSKFHIIADYQVSKIKYIINHYAIHHILQKGIYLVSMDLIGIFLQLKKHI